MSSSSNSFTFSNNLVEIGALTALIGSSAAESLTLGSRGTAGVGWAASSSFGAVSVVRACLAGACPGWLRESLGIRSVASDDALGFELPMDARTTRRPIAGHVALFSHLPAEKQPHDPLNSVLGWEGSVATLTRSERICVYEADESLRMRLREVPKVPAESRLRVNTPADYAYAQPSAAFFQTAVYIASAAKLTEFYALWRLGASTPAVLTSIPWAFFFLGALFLQIYDRRGSVYGRLDLVAGQLPADPNPGGARIVVLGASRDPRTQLGWRFFWGTGAVVTAASVVGTYISLSDAPRNTIFIWAAFQILWLLLRTLVHYALPIALDPSRPIFRYGIGPGERLQGNAYEDLPPMVKARVTNLVLAVGQAQTLSHRRGRHHYFADSFSLATVPLVQKHRAVDDLCPLPNDVPRTVSMKLAITAVVGDTALCSSLWLFGHSPPPLAVPYYSCVVIFSIPDQPLFAIPSARVLGVTPLRDLGRGAGGDAESASVAAAQHTWWYWIPATNGRWLEFRLDGCSSLNSEKESARFVEAIVRSDADLDAFLQLGTLNSSGMRNVGEAREAAKISRMGRDGLLELFGSGI